MNFYDVFSVCFRKGDLDQLFSGFAVRAVVKTDLQKNMIGLDIFLCLHLCQVGILKRWQPPHVILPLGQFAVVDEGVGQELLQRK